MVELHLRPYFVSRIRRSTCFARRCIIGLILSVGLTFQAQEQPKEEASSKEPLVEEKKRSVVQKPEREPPPEVLAGPTVVLRTSEKRTVYEFRVNGRLTRIKVVPKNGRPYYLVPVNRSQHLGEFRQNTRLERVSVQTRIPRH